MLNGGIKKSWASLFKHGFNFNMSIKTGLGVEKGESALWLFDHGTAGYGKSNQSATVAVGSPPVQKMSQTLMSFLSS